MPSTHSFRLWQATVMGFFQSTIRSLPPLYRPSARGRWIRKLASTNLPVTVSWSSVRIGGRLRGRVIALDDYRD